jgi:hypothetical protein
MWTIDRAAFKEAVKHIAIETFRDKKQFIEKISLFQHLSWEHSDLLIEGLIMHKFEAG